MKTSTITVVLATAAFALTAGAAEDTTVETTSVELTTLPEQVSITVGGDTVAYTSGDTIEISEELINDEGQARVVIHEDGFNTHSKMLDVSDTEADRTHALLPQTEQGWDTWCADLADHPDQAFHDVEGQC